MPTTARSPARQTRRGGRSSSPARRGSQPKQPKQPKRGGATGWLHRNQAQPKSPLNEVLSKLPRSHTAPMPQSRKGKAGGLALLAGAAALALKNRDKLTAILKRQRSSDEPASPADGPPVDGTPMDGTPATGGTEAPLGHTAPEAPPTGPDAPPTA